MATGADIQAMLDAIHRVAPQWQPSLFLQSSLSVGANLPLVPNSVVDAIRREAPPGVFDANGQIVNPAPNAPTLPRPSSPTRPNRPPPPNIPGPATGTPIDRDLARPPNHLHELSGRGHPCKSAKNVPHDDVKKYIDGYNAIVNATEQGPQNPGWDATIRAINTELQNGLRLLGDGFTGQAAGAMKANLDRSFQVLEQMRQHAETMETLFQAFFDDLSTTKQNFAQYMPQYNEAAAHPDEPSSQETLNQLNDLVVGIMNVYRGPIDEISTNHPSVNSAVPDVSPPTDGPSRAGSGTPSGTGGGTPQTLPQQGLNTGEPARLTGPDNAQPDNTGGKSAPTSPAGGQDGGGDSGKGGADGSGKAGSQGSDPASKTLGGAGQGDPKAGVGGPTGLLGPGAKGLSSALKAGSGGSGAGGAGGRGAINAKPAANVPATPKVANSAAPVSRAGVSSAGQGTGGTPVAGHQGNKADKTHKASKALRLPKNGEEVAGEADAVAPVIGGAPPKATPPTPKKT